MFKSKLIPYVFDADLGTAGIRRVTVNAYGVHHARWKAEELLKCAGYTVRGLRVAPQTLPRLLAA